MGAVQTPKLRVPFTVTNGRVAVVEQDSTQEVAQCVYAILATQRGSRFEDPELGIEEPAFEEGGMDLGEALAALATWEPRAEVETEAEIEGLTEQVRVEVRGP